jgi:hypothetical protein
MLLTITSNAPSAATLTVANANTDTGYRVLAETNWGNVAWEIAYSGARGTQGAVVANGVPQNRPVILSIRCAGTTKDDLAAKISALESSADELRRYGGTIKWQSNNSSYAVYFTVLAGSARVEEWGNRSETINRTVVMVECMCAPYLKGDPMDITDAFSSDTRTNYTWDGGASSNVSVSSNQLAAAANVTTENRAVHTAVGYSYGDVQATVKSIPGATITSYKQGVILKRTSATDYLEVYVDDTGANSRLRLDKVVAGSRTNLQSTTLGSRITASTPFWVRGRVEGNIVYRELFTAAAPTPMGTPDSAPTSYTLSGAEATAFGSAVTGKAGFSWTPQATAARMDDFTVEPYTYRNATTPTTQSLYGAIPGDSPALADVTITPSGGSAAPVWAMLGWTQRVASGLATAPFGSIAAANGSSLATWTVSGNTLTATPAGAGTASALFSIDPSLITLDDYTQGEIDIEVWGRIGVHSAVVSPKLIVSAQPTAGTSFGQERYTNEYGSAGKLLTISSSGQQWRFNRLGTLTLLSNPAGPLVWKIKLAASWATGSAGVFDVDYLTLVPARTRALGPTGKANDSTYPKFVASTAQTSKTIRSDLSGLVSSPPANAHPDSGLGGQLLELPTGSVDTLVKLSSLVPDDPTSDSTSEQANHSASVHYSITPRYRMLRAS